ncbi:hypothetical protein [Thiomicrorhabdus xiamenensis]|uniref:Uncharacterized protein n=1 Tax=Thiomicrorhabdus xiamenensis TaxID=2739063 RepID=A0A7D4P4J6_9GAMM|nr:hypothetical protein [Thiomicrorhabdus xiamenensis]QKI89296.1 hypothetical protein HQN79_06810 [Thiomicrorhabdus xiamenensis]
MSPKIHYLRSSQQLETTEVQADELAVALPAHILERLIREGAIRPSELRPLHAQAKQEIKRFCLSACQGRDCVSCIFRNKCHFREE